MKKQAMGWLPRSGLVLRIVIINSPNFQKHLFVGAFRTSIDKQDVRSCANPHSFILFKGL
jgi:hypothetical protein